MNHLWVSLGRLGGDPAHPRHGTLSSFLAFVAVKILEFLRGKTASQGRVASSLQRAVLASDGWGVNSRAKGSSARRSSAADPPHGLCQQGADSRDPENFLARAMNHCNEKRGWS